MIGLEEPCNLCSVILSRSALLVQVAVRWWLQRRIAVHGVPHLLRVCPNHFDKAKIIDRNSRFDKYDGGEYFTFSDQSVIMDLLSANNSEQYM